MKFSNSHLSFEQLADALDNRLPGNLQKRVREHLNDCSHCARDLASLEKVVGLMRRDDSASAPPAAHRFVIDLFRTGKSFAPKNSVVQIIKAVLKLDLLASSPIFGERSGTINDERQMLFAADAFDIDLRIKPVDNSFIVKGQILGELKENSRIRLENDDFTLETAVSEFGEFQFANVPNFEDMRVSLIFN